MKMDMKVSKRDIILLIALVVIAGGVAYFFLFLQPTLGRMEVLRGDIESRTAELRLSETAALQRIAEYDRLLEENTALFWTLFQEREDFDERELYWETGYGQFIPVGDFLNDLFFLERAQSIIYPRVAYDHNPMLRIALSEPEPWGEELFVISLTLEFVAEYYDFLAIVQEFLADDDVIGGGDRINRVMSYSFNVGYVDANPYVWPPVAETRLIEGMLTVQYLVR